MDELEELHRELDVADAAPPALELAVGEALARAVSASARSFIARISRIASGSSVSGHTYGRVERDELLAERVARRPTGRALSSAWNSHVRPQSA